MIHDIFTNISILVAFLLVIGQVFKRSNFDTKQSLKIQVLLGVVFGILGVILMLFTIKMAHNVIIDLRNVAIICSGIMGGPLAASVAAVIIAIYRVILFGTNIASITGLITALLIGAGAAYICSTKLSRLSKYVLIFMLSMLLSNGALIFLIDDKIKLLETLAYYWPTYIFGAILAYFTCEYIISANVNYIMKSYYTMTADNLLDMISTHEPGGKVIFVTPSIAQLFGYNPEEFIGTSSYEYIHPEDINIIKKTSSVSKKTGDNYTQVFRMRRKDGKYIWVETTVRNIMSDDGSVKEMICVTRDITTRKKVEQELRVSNARLTAIFDNAGTGIVLRDCDENLIDANQAYLDMLGYTKEEMNQLSNIIHPEDSKHIHDIVEDLVSGKCSSHRSEVRYIDKNKQIIYADVTTTYIPGTEYGKASIIRVVNNITERKIKEEELLKAKSEVDKLVATDFLTGVLSRRAFSERFEEEFHRAASEKSPICILIADIDHFKQINDTHGHQVGDLVLQKFSICLSEVCRQHDFIGRQGGEEFIVCLPSTDKEQGKRVAERMRIAVEELSIKLLYLKEPIKLSASFGVASNIPDKGETTEKLIMQADDAMYEAKEKGRNMVCTVEN